MNCNLKKNPGINPGLKSTYVWVEETSVECKLVKRPFKPQIKQTWYQYGYLKHLDCAMQEKIWVYPRCYIRPISSTKS